tara:strand:+ start:26981 stop:27481 length:501 start_codon:yes stop_codon:yes gene_type:complete
MTVKEYSASDAQRVNNDTSIGNQYLLTFELPDGKKLSIKGQHPDSLANSANSMINVERNRIAATGPYKDAVKHLSEIALTQDGSGAYAAAQVLLSSYNGSNYQLNITDLCNLDDINFKCAQAVIAGRVHTQEEPHNIIENGSSIFQKLEEKWSNLRVKNRYLKYYE